MTQRERRLAIITVAIVAFSLLLVYVYLPLAESRAAALERIPALEAQLTQVQGQSTQSRRLVRDSGRILATMGNPNATLVPAGKRLEAQKKLMESLQGMDWDKPYNISAGSLERGETVDRIAYQVSGKVPWDHFLNKLGELENYEYLNKVENINITMEGKANISMRVTLFLAPEDMAEPPPEPKEEPEEGEDEGESGEEASPAS